MWEKKTKKKTNTPPPPQTRKAVNVRANRVFFCVNSIRPFVNPELKNTTYPEIWGTRYAEKGLKQLVFYTKLIQHQNPSKMHTSDIMYNWSENQKLSILKTVGGVICTIEVPFW